MELIKKKILSAKNYIIVFSKWLLLAVVTGLIGGAVGGAFHYTVEYVTKIRQNNEFLILFLPIGGLIIVFLYRMLHLKKDPGTNRVLMSVRTHKEVPFSMAPLIFISTAITHLLGGSAGREGAALQLGGSIGTFVGKIFHLDEKDMHLIVMCGMSGVFSALFGTPLTATVFAMEVVSVGIMYYSGLMPCLISSLVAYGISILMGNHPVRFTLDFVPDVGLLSILQVILLSAFCALVSIIFCTTMKYSYKGFRKFIPNQYLRILVGGFAIIILTYLLKTKDYNGAGMDIIQNAISGHAIGYAFLLKIIFTAITISSGYKGGEIVPTFFIGATFGCFMGNIIGLNSGFGAAVGIIALFCGVVNCPLAAAILSVELFGADSFILCSVAVAVSYMLSGYYGLYSQQKIMYSKLKAEFININAK